MFIFLLVKFEKRWLKIIIYFIFLHYDIIMSFTTIRDNRYKYGHVQFQAISLLNHIGTLFDSN